MTRRFDPVRISLLLSFVAINLAVGGVVSWLKLPFYLDSVGIVLSTILLGWVYGVICAVLTVFIGFFLINPYLPFYVLTSVSIVLMVEILRRRDMYRTMLRTVLSGVVVGLVSAILSAPVTALLFGGVTASGADVLTALFARAGKSLYEAVFLAGLSSEPIDKTVVALVAVSALRGLPDRFLHKFELRGYRNISTAATGGM
jgi:energy-coupling factor transport system substrate-specific component